MVTRCLPLFLSSTVLLALPVAASDLDGFQPPAGKGDFALSLSLDSYDHFFVGSNRVESPAALGEIDNTSWSLWWRHGLTDRLAVVASLPYVETEGDGTANFDESDPQDLAALLQYQVLSREARGRHSVVVGGGIRTPVANYSANLPVSVGDGTTDALLRVVYLYQWGRSYVSQQLGYDIRGEDAPDGFPLTTTVARMFGPATVSVMYQRYIADGGTDIGDPGFTFPSNKEQFERLWAKVYTRINDSLGLSAAAFTTLDGRNTGDSRGLSLGMVYSY